MALLGPAGKLDYRRAFVAILIAAFVLRLLWVLLVPVRPMSDSAVYDELAWNLATRNSYAWDRGEFTAHWPVGTSFIYSLAYRLFGHDFGPLAAMNLLAGTATTALIMMVARRWTSQSAALAAGALYAFWPSQIEYSSILASELWFNLSVLAGICVLFVFPPRSLIHTGLLAGLCFAAAAYIRPLAIPLVLVAPAGLIWSRRAGWKGAATVSLAACAALALAIAPWTLRNWRVLGEPVLISTNGPPVTWMGNNPDSTGAYMGFPADTEGLGEIERSHVLGARARQFVIENPLRAAELALRKLVLTHDRETIGIVWNQRSLEPAIGPRGILAAKIVSTLYWYAALALALAGAAIVLARERWRGLIHPALLLWAYFAAVHAATIGADRFHIPSIPYIAMLAGIAAMALLHRLRPAQGAGG